MDIIDVRVAREDDFAAMADLDGRVFGEVWPENLLDAAQATLEFDRFRLAHDRGDLVGIAGIHTREVTVPGGAQLPFGGVTWVAVAPTHRRRGLLRRLMAELHDDIDGRGEPLAMLTASEGGIYERFGYGTACFLRAVEIDRHRVAVRPEFRPEPGAVRMTSLVDPEIARIFDRYRKQRSGEVDRTEAGEALFRAQEGTAVSVAKHRDGFAIWKVAANWNEGHPAHQLTLIDLLAITPEAHAALWHTVLSVDLVGTIKTFRAVALDDHLPYIVTDQRAIRTTNVNDMLWINVRDVGAALGARAYGTDDELIVEIRPDDAHGGRARRWRVSGGPTGAEVSAVRSRPHLTMDRAALGAIYLGGVKPGTLARAGRVVGTTESLRRADAFFMADRLPHCSTGF